MCPLRRLFFGAALAGVALGARGQGSRDDDELLERIDDLRTLGARIRRERLPLLVLFSTPGCPYCREVRRSYLRPRIREAPATAMIREADVTSARRIIDHAGQSVSEAEFARRHRVKVVPHVVLLDAAGTALTEPLIGIDGGGFYEAFLSTRIEEARHLLNRR